MSLDEYLQMDCIILGWVLRTIYWFHSPLNIGFKEIRNDPLLWNSDQWDGIPLGFKCFIQKLIFKEEMNNLYIFALFILYSTWSVCYGCNRMDGPARPLLNCNFDWLVWQLFCQHEVTIIINRNSILSILPGTPRNVAFIYANLLFAWLNNIYICPWY